MVSIKKEIPKKMKNKVLKPPKTEKLQKIKEVKVKKQLLNNENQTKKPAQDVVREVQTKKKKNYVMLSKSVTVSDENQAKKAAQDVVREVQTKKKKKYVMPSKIVTEQLVIKSLEALEQLTKHYKKKNSLLDDETPIFAEIQCIKIQTTKGNVKYVYPHSTVASTGEVCLITPDLKKGQKVDHEPTIDHWEELLRKAGVTDVKTVLPMRQLRVEYDQFELKRRLLTQHDFIMVDTRVINHVSHLLGNKFFKKHNMLIPVRINEKTLKEDIDVGLRTAMHRMSEGVTSTIIVGHTGMPQNKLKENVLSLVQQLRERFPGGEANVRKLSLKLPLSLSLPLYLTLRPSSTVPVPKLKKPAPKNFRTVEDELSTIPGSTVRVAPDGTVHLKKGAVPDLSDMEVEDADGESNEELEEEN